MGFIITTAKAKKERTRSRDSEELKPTACEISGIEVIPRDGRRGRIAELDASDAVAVRSSALPVSNNAQKLTIPPADPGSVQHEDPRGAGDLTGNDHVVVVDRQADVAHPAPSQTPQLPDIDPVSPINAPNTEFLPLRASSVDRPSQHVSPLESPTSAVSEENPVLRGLLANLENIERRRKQRASKLMLLQEEETAMRVQEAAILEEIRRRAGKIPAVKETPGPSPPR
ncbi:hypothetical protein AJ79_03648 [Helicocarpus griseus UAMH5409]|uniref:Uncharacterized protein n=1 Tax=Helicocarpus griseus UAMH5409 TaxID=1447875 RepID=A0A2B7XYH2_9EURO|nr:hypothetical protein AJ79_03648 [Helicocarpus griseus UAMH5409]